VENPYHTCHNAINGRRDATSSSTASSWEKKRLSAPDNVKIAKKCQRDLLRSERDLRKCQPRPRKRPRKRPAKERKRPTKEPKSPRKRPTKE
jgi:hypothetical protein